MLQGKKMKADASVEVASSSGFLQGLNAKL